MAFPEVLWIVLALAAAGLIKGLIGLGLPLIAIPVMSQFMALEQAILIMALPSAVVNCWQAVALRRHRSADFGVVPFLAGTMVGVTMGAAAFTVLSERALAVVMALWIVLYLAVRVFAPQARLQITGARKLAPFTGMAAGLAQVSTGIPGPVVAIYFHAFSQHARQFAFSVSSAFALLGFLQLLAVNLLGVYNKHHFVLGALACLPALVTMFWAGRFADKVPEKKINLLIYTVLLAIAGRLLFSAGAGGQAG